MPDSEHHYCVIWDSVTQNGPLNNNLIGLWGDFLDKVDHFRVGIRIIQSQKGAIILILKINHKRQTIVILQRIISRRNLSIDVTFLVLDISAHFSPTLILIFLVTGNRFDSVFEERVFFYEVDDVEFDDGAGTVTELEEKPLVVTFGVGVVLHH